MIKINLLPRKSLASVVEQFFVSKLRGQVPDSLSQFREKSVATITYLENGQKKSLDATDLNDVQVILDDLRQMGAQICEVKQKIFGVKESLLRIALRDGSQ